MPLAERIAVSVATAAALFQFVVARYLPEHQGHLDPDFPRMSPAQSAWMIAAPAFIIGALALARRASRDSLRRRMTFSVAILAVVVVVSHLWVSCAPV
jgi:small-conductance mechanosensitive channel